MPINYKLYPPDWKRRIVPHVLDRAGHRCEECQVANGSIVFSAVVRFRIKDKLIYRREWLRERPSNPEVHYKPVKVVLTVAHLDHDRSNHKVALDRLKALCQLCHLRLDSHMKAKRRECGTHCNFPNCSKHGFEPFCAR